MKKETGIKLIININPGISIWADREEYVVTIGANKKVKALERWYFSTLEQCFIEILDYMQRNRLIEGKEKTMEEIVKILKDTKNEIWSLFRPLTSLK